MYIKHFTASLAYLSMRFMIAILGKHVALSYVPRSYQSAQHNVDGQLICVNTHKLIKCDCAKDAHDLLTGHIPFLENLPVPLP